MKTDDDNKWYEIQVIPIGTYGELVASQLFDMGSSGVVEESNSLRAYFSKRVESSKINELKKFLTTLHGLSRNSPLPDVVVTELENKDWALQYREHFKAQPLASKFFLVPTWDVNAPVPWDRLAIILEAGQAFGTGLHASTRLALSSLEQTVALFGSSRQLRLLDVGTGTGILAIAAEKLGLATIDAVDNDPDAVLVALENCRMNHCIRTSVMPTPIEQLKGPYEIILSNILLETHRNLASTYRRLLAPGGTLTVSGLLGYQRFEMEKCFNAVGLVKESWRSMQDWVALNFVRSQGD